MRISILLAAAGALAFAQPAPEVLLHESFDSSTGGWMAVGQGSGVRSDAAESALAFEYTLAPERLALMALPVPPAALARAGRFRFALKSDHATAMAMLIREKKPGGNYMAWFWAPANQWQKVELSPADFTLADGPNDPPDADGKLDLSEAESIGILDLAQFFGTLKGTAPLPVRIAESFGPHKLLLKSFDILAEASNGSTPALDRGFLDWVSPGAMDLKLSDADNPLKERSVEASYQHHDGELDLLVHREAAISGKPTRLAFDLASEREVTLVVSLEMRKPGGGVGPRYTLPIFPPGGREVFHVDLSLADFKGPDHFDPAQWRTTTIVDVTEGDGPNTLWIGNLRTSGN